jgi:hypothetical protein
MALGAARGKLPKCIPLRPRHRQHAAGAIEAGVLAQWDGLSSIGLGF